MKKIISTWICIDDKAGGTYFPQAKGNSADSFVQQIYWRCICTFFWCARYHNPDAYLVLFSNKNHLPNIDEISVAEVLRKLDVHFYVTPFEYITPDGYSPMWRNQFYEFSVFKFATIHKDFNDDDQFLLVDSDCIITGDLSPMFDLVKKEGCINYVINYKVNHNINGNTREGMKEIFEELLAKKIDEIPSYYGGEFYASTITVLKTLMSDFYPLWEQMLDRHSRGLKKLNEEAHVLSYLFYKHGFKNGYANKYIKRLWTDPTNTRNVKSNDANLLIWHLPAEKRKGFKKFYSWLHGMNFNLDKVNKDTFRKQIQRTFSVPVIALEKIPYYFAKSMIKKIISSKWRTYFLKIWDKR